MAKDVSVTVSLLPDNGQAKSDHSNTEYNVKYCMYQFCVCHDFYLTV